MSIDYSEWGAGNRSDVGYRLFIDEVGNDRMSRFEYDTNRYLSLTGLIIDNDHARRVLHPRLEKLKAECFVEHPDECVILHRREIVAHRGPFSVLWDPRMCSEFEHELYRIFSETTFLVVTAIIDKQAHSHRYEVWRYNPYHYCLKVLLERYVMELQGKSASGDVVVEARGKKDDKALKKSYRLQWERGTDLGAGGIDASDMQTRLTSREVKLVLKSDNMAGLQLADLLAKPCHDLMLSQRDRGEPPRNFSKKLTDLLTAAKFRRNRRGIIEGWGQKWLP